MKAQILRLLPLFLLICALAQPAHASEQTILIFGDSLSAAYGIRPDQGWVTILEERLIQQKIPFQVINASVSGETSTGGLARLPSALATHNPDLVLLELGGNDGLRGLPLASLEANLETMIDMIDAAGAKVVLAGIQIPPNYGPRYTVPFFDIFEKLATRKNIALVPFLIDGIPQQPELMQADGIHPKAEAQIMILENVWPTLQPILIEAKNSSD